MMNKRASGFLKAAGIFLVFLFLFGGAVVFGLFIGVESHKIDIGKNHGGLDSEARDFMRMRCEGATTFLDLGGSAVLCSFQKFSIMNGSGNFYANCQDKLVYDSLSSGAKAAVNKYCGQPYNSGLSYLTNKCYELSLESGFNAGQTIVNGQYCSELISQNPAEENHVKKPVTDLNPFTGQPEVTYQ